MAFQVSVQTAPERRGSMALDLTGWAGATPTLSGVYQGETTRTLTFTVTSAGTTTIGTHATITLEWVDSEGDEGVLNLGTSDGYTANQAIALDARDGVSIAFAAGNLVNADTFVATFTAANRIPADHRILTGTPEPTDITITRFGRMDLDARNVTFDGRQTKVERAILRSLSARFDWLDADAREKTMHWEESRAHLTIAENYDEHTLLLWRGGTADPSSDGLLPVIGPRGTFSRTGLGAYLDRDKGLYRLAATGVPRYEAGQMGRALLFGAGANTNIQPRFHPKSGTLGWSGTGTLTFDTGVPGMLDPDDPNWSSAFRAGVLRWDAAAADSINTGDATVADSDFTAGDTVTAQVWLKGRGTVNIAIRGDGGGGTPNTNRGVLSSQLLTSEWTRYTVTAATVSGGGADTAIDIAIGAVDAAVVYVSVSQLELGFVPTAPIETDGNDATRGAETLTFAQQISPIAGTISFWYYHPGDPSSGFTRFLSASAGGLELRYDAANNEIEFSTGAAGSALAVGFNLVAGTWYHIAATWAYSSASTITREIFVQGASQGAGTANAGSWDSDWGGTITLFGTGGGANTAHAVKIQELRIDGRAWNAAEVLDQYERFTTDSWRPLVLETAGRRFEPVNVEEVWPEPQLVNHDRYVWEGELAEVGRESSALMVSS